MVEYGLLHWVPFFPHFGQKCRAGRGQGGCSSGSWDYTAAGPRVQMLSMVTLTSREPGPRILYGILLGSTVGQGPQPLARHSVTLYSPGRV